MTDKEPIYLISLGAGVQSSTMALMAAAGEITPMPQAAIFADTQAEPASVYRWLDWLEKQLPFPVHRVSKGNLEAEGLLMRRSRKGVLYSKTDIPFFTLSPDGEKGKIRGRACTADYKIRPLLAQARKIIGRPSMTAWRREHSVALKKLTAWNRLSKNEKKRAIYPAEAWLECQADPLVLQIVGISLDEIGRAKESRDPWARTTFPLINKRMRREDCLRWMADHGFPEPPRSACVFCPFHDNKEWRRLQADEPEEFERAVQFERSIQAAKANSENFASIPYLHRSCKPLDTIDFRSDIERGQGVFDWQDECTGMCGN